MGKDRMKIKRSLKCLLISLTFILNLVLRYPATPHEIGWDSFVIHISANSISSFGYIKWWLDPTSIFGFHPYSYASSVPLLLSGISQNMAIDMEWTVWLFSTMIGVFSLFTAYLMAGAIEEDDFFKILVSIIYSTLGGILYFTTWTVSTRGLFIVLLPLFVYNLLKTRSSLKHIILLPLIFLLLATTHHLFYYLAIPTIAYLMVQILFRFNNLKIYLGFPKRNPNINPNIIQSSILLLCFIIMFIIPFFTRTFIVGGSRYVYLISQFIEYSRHIGILIICIFGAVLYLMAKHNKTFEELFLLIMFIGITPLIYVEKYTKWFFLPIAVLLIGIGLKNTIESTIDKKRNYAPLAVILLLTLQISFGGYFQYLNNLNDSDINTRYMREETYIGALWIKDNINKSLFGNDITTSQRIFSIAEIPTLTGSSFDDLAYGFVDPENLNVTLERSYLSLGFYLYDPYVDCNPSTSWNLNSIIRTSINERGSYAQRGIKKFNLSYFIENRYFQNTFSISVKDTEKKIYDNGVIKIWELGDKNELNI